MDKFVTSLYSYKLTLWQMTTDSKDRTGGKKITAPCKSISKYITNYKNMKTTKTDILIWARIQHETSAQLQIKS